MNIKEKVIKTIDEHSLIAPGDKVLVAVSGGADSVCLLHVLNDIKDDLKITLGAVHLNHMIRANDADQDENFVRNLCSELKIPFFCSRINVSEMAETEKLTVEEAGRKARYEFFRKIKTDEKFDKIATAHNKNDRAETVLMRILRGTGLDGLKGISYSRDDGVIRPLLDVSREEIELYLKNRSVRFCSDYTNADNNYTRNRIRNEVLPYLSENFNPSIIEALVRFSEVVSEDADFLNAYAKRLYERLNNPLPSHKPSALHIDTLKILDYSIKSRLVMIAAEKASGKKVKLEYKHILDILELLEKQTGAGVDLPFGLRVENNYGWLVFINKNEEKETASKGDTLDINVIVPGKYYLGNIKRTVSFRLADPKNYKKNEREIMLDYDMLKEKKLVIRNRLKGDKMICFKDGKEKKLKKIFIDSKIERKDRDKIPLLCADGEIAAIIGSRVSEKYKVTNKTEEALLIEYGKNQSAD